MSHIAENLLRFHSRLQEFLETEEYSDVTVKCENKMFKCHRLALAMASNYFNTMFNGNFRESTARNVVLRDINASSFKEVLKFIYTGDVSINSTNVFTLLRASEFFELPGMETLCVEFVQKKQLTVENTFDIFAFAITTKKNTLMEIASEYIIEHFGVFSKTSRFYEMPFENVSLILNKYSNLPSRNKEFLMVTLVQWICHASEERFQYFHNLARTIRFTDISSECVQYMIGKIIAANQKLIRAVQHGDGAIVVMEKKHGTEK